MFDSIYNNCDPSPKKISCFCGEAVVKMSNGRPRRVTECCCVDCFQHLEWASVNGGPQVPIIRSDYEKRPVLSATIHPDIKLTLIAISDRTGMSVSQVTDEVLYTGLVEMQELHEHEE